MKTYKLLFALGMLLFFGCEEDEEPVKPNLGNSALFIENQILCAGQSSKIHAVLLDTWEEIPISDLVFEALDPADGEITGDGIYIAPENLSQNRVVKIYAEFKNGSKEQVTGEIKISPTGSFPNSWVKTINGQLAGRPYDFLENGDLILGSALGFMDEPSWINYEISRMSPDGQLIWNKVLPTGNSMVVKVKNEKIYSAGDRQFGSFGSYDNYYIAIMDLKGEILNEIELGDQGYITSINVDDDSNIYISTLNYQEFGLTFSVILKLDERGSLISEYKLPYDVEDFKVTNEKVIVGLGSIPDGNIGKEVLFVIDPEENKIREINTKKLDHSSSFSKLFLLPSGEIGLIRHGGFPDRYWGLEVFNLDGSMVQNRVLLKSAPYSNEVVKPRNTLEKNLLLVHHVLVASNGEVYIAGTSFNKYFTFFEILSLNGKQWSWWQLNPDLGYGTFSFSEHENGLVLIAHQSNEILSFKLDYDLNFDPCLYNPLWGY